MKEYKEKGVSFMNTIKINGINGEELVEIKKGVYKVRIWWTSMQEEIEFYYVVNPYNFKIVIGEYMANKDVEIIQFEKVANDIEVV